MRGSCRYCTHERVIWNITSTASTAGLTTLRCSWKRYINMDLKFWQLVSFLLLLSHDWTCGMGLNCVKSSQNASLYTKLNKKVYYVCFGNLSLFASYAMLMRPKKAETAVHGCQQSGSGSQNKHNMLSVICKHELASISCAICRLMYCIYVL